MTPGDKLGSYRILREIGAGGTSRVYLAERAGGHLTGLVAVKILDPIAGAGQGAERRFQGESSILAAMQHPRIARLLDSGFTDRGRPYHVVEYVDGLPITEHCDRQGLPLGERLDLFVKVCQAVEYAHGRLVVHRDLKPGNILVTREGSVKLLDFGIAQWLDEQPAAADTGPSAMAITPEYASPEQFRGEPVTTATDIYSLGVVLYELLAGRRPHDLQGASPGEMETIVCGRDPDPPSIAGEASRLLKGDLDNIVLKTLRRDPAERYASARELAEDISRHREGLPVLASAITTRYRLAKFVRRRPLGAGFAAAMGLATIGFLAALVGLQVRTVAARDRARSEADTARAASDFLLELFDAGGMDSTARDLLERGASRAGSISGDPLLQARILGVMGRAYSSLGRDDRSEPLLRQVVGILRQESGDEARAVGAALDELGTVQRLSGRPAEAEATLRQAVEVLDRYRNDPEGLWLTARGHLGQALAEQGRFDDAEPFLAGAHGEALSHLGEAHAATRSVSNQLAWMRAEQGRFDEAAVLYRAVLEAREETLGKNHPLVAESLSNLGYVLRRKGDYAEAESHYRQAVAIRRQVLDPDHPSLARVLDNLGVLMGIQGRFDESEALFRESLEILRRRLGDANPEVATSMNNLAVLFDRKGDYEKSIRIQEEVIALRRRVLGEKHPLVAASLGNLASTLILMGRFAEAEARARRAVEIETEVYGRRNPNTASSIGDLAAALLRQGRLEEAEALHREALSIRRETLGEAHPDVATSLRSLGLVLTERDAYDEAEASLRASLDLRRKLLGDKHHRVAQVLDDLGVLMMRRGDYASGEHLLLESLSIGEGALGAGHPRVRETIAHLADLYERTDRPEKAAEQRRRLEVAR